MNMVVVVMTFKAIILAKCVFDGIVCCRDRMNNALINKGLKCSVNGDPVESLTGLMLYVSMGKGATVGEEKVEDLFPAIGNAEVVAP